MGGAFAGGLAAALLVGGRVDHLAEKLGHAPLQGSRPLVGAGRGVKEPLKGLVLQMERVGGLAHLLGPAAVGAADFRGLVEDALAAGELLDGDAAQFLHAGAALLVQHLADVAALLDERRKPRKAVGQGHAVELLEVAKELQEGQLLDQGFDLVGVFGRVKLRVDALHLVGRLAGVERAQAVGLLDEGGGFRRQAALEDAALVLLGLGGFHELVDLEAVVVAQGALQGAVDGVELRAEGGDDGLVGAGRVEVFADAVALRQGGFLAGLADVHALAHPCAGDAAAGRVGLADLGAVLEDVHRRDLGQVGQTDLAADLRREFLQDGVQHAEGLQDLRAANLGGLGHALHAAERVPVGLQHLGQTHLGPLVNLGAGVGSASDLVQTGFDAVDFGLGGDGVVVYSALSGWSISSE